MQRVCVRVYTAAREKDRAHTHTHDAAARKRRAAAAEVTRNDVILYASALAIAKARCRKKLSAREKKEVLLRGRKAFALDLGTAAAAFLLRARVLSSSFFFVSLKSEM